MQEASVFLSCSVGFASYDAQQLRFGQSPSGIRFVRYRFLLIKKVFFETIKTFVLETFSCFNPMQALYQAELRPVYVSLYIMQKNKKQDNFFFYYILELIGAVFEPGDVLLEYRA